MVGGELVAACVRKPATVVGGGQKTVSELAEALDAKVRSQNADNRMRLDATILKLMAKKGIIPSTVLAKGQPMGSAHCGASKDQHLRCGCHGLIQIRVRSSSSSMYSALAQPTDKHT